MIKGKKITAYFYNQDCSRLVFTEMIPLGRYYKFVSKNGILYEHHSDSELWNYDKYLSDEIIENCSEGGESLLYIEQSSYLNLI